MKLFKDTNNEVFAYAADGSQDSLIGDKSAITQEEANQLISNKHQEEFNSLPYSEKREHFYPPMTDYLDAIVKGNEEQLNKYIADCLAVKTRFPKSV